ncbi:MAG: GMC family oxidoreductase [Chlamydiia bacterium]|nr:GMC family oxidoreductase [Chlamydiia bacterium]
MKQNKLFPKLILGLAALMLCPLSASSTKDLITYDYIIVGNGTAGATLARKLSDDKKTKVLVLERGINHDDDPLVLQTSGSDLAATWTTLSYNTKYSDTWAIAVLNPLQTTNYTVGRGWGGSSMHNYLDVVRGTPSIYDGWSAAAGDDSWNYNNLLPIMKAIENYTPNADAVFDAAQRGSGGPIQVTQTPSITADALALAFETPLNVGFVADYNDPTLGTPGIGLGIGMGPYELFAYPGAFPGTTGDRSFSSNAFLPRSVIRKNGVAKDGRLLRIESNSTVSRVFFKGKKAHGVEFVYGDNPNKVIKALGKKIILCAGSVYTPAILQRSGIGDAALLNSLGIPVIVDNPNVGANFDNQYGPQVVVSGTTTSAAPSLQAFVNASGTPALPAPYDYTADLPTNKRRLQFIASNIAPGLTNILAFIMDPQSKGSIEITSRDALVSPDINLAIYSDGAFTTHGTDANLAVTFFKLLRQVAGITLPAPLNTTVDDLDFYLYARSPSGMVVSSHISGSARMGQSAADSVVNNRLEVFGVEGLYVGDLSVAPVIPDGNTCFAVYVIAMKLAEILGVPVVPAL